MADKNCDQESSVEKHRCNKDDLRTHMANERTFLSWCRTSISLIVFGFVLGRLELLAKLTKNNILTEKDMQLLTQLELVGFFCFILAGIIIMVSGWRFLYVRKKIMKAEIDISIFPEIMVIVSMITLIIMIITLLIGSV